MQIYHNLPFGLATAAKGDYIVLCDLATAMMHLAFPTWLFLILHVESGLVSVFDKKEVGSLYPKGGSALLIVPYLIQEHQNLKTKEPI